MHKRLAIRLRPREMAGSDKGVVEKIVSGLSYSVPETIGPTRAGTFFAERLSLLRQYATRHRFHSLDNSISQKPPIEASVELWLIGCRVQILP